MMLSDQLATLRVLLHEPPTHRSWKAIASLFTDWPIEMDLGVGLDYAETHLEHWPDRLRMVQFIPEPNNLPICWPLVRTVAPPAKKITNTDARLRAYVTNSCARSIRCLLLWGCHLTHKSVMAIAASRHLGHLKELDVGGLLRNPSESVEAIRAVAKAPYAHQLRWLGWSGNHLEPSGLELLVSTPLAHDLVHLDLSSNPLHDKGIKILSSASALYSLQTLDISSALHTKAAPVAVPNTLLTTARRLLGRSRTTPTPSHQNKGEGLEHLHTLNARRNRLRTDDLFKLLEALPTPVLRHLDVSYNQLNAQTLRALPRWARFAQLSSLDLRSNSLDDAAAEIIAQNPRWGDIETLHLDGQFSDQSRRTLLEAKHISTVTRMDVLRGISPYALPKFARYCGVHIPAQTAPRDVVHTMAAHYTTQS